MIMTNGKCGVLPVPPCCGEYYRANCCYHHGADCCYFSGEADCCYQYGADCFYCYRANCCYENARTWLAESVSNGSVHGGRRLHCHLKSCTECRHCVWLKQTCSSSDSSRCNKKFRHQAIAAGWLGPLTTCLSKALILMAKSRWQVEASFFSIGSPCSWVLLVVQPIGCADVVRLNRDSTAVPSDISIGRSCSAPPRSQVSGVNDPGFLSIAFSRPLVSSWGGYAKNRGSQDSLRTLGRMPIPGVGHKSAYGEAAKGTASLATTISCRRPCFLCSADKTLAKFSILLLELVAK